MVERVLSNFRRRLDSISTEVKGVILKYLARFYVECVRLLNRRTHFYLYRFLQSCGYPFRGTRNVKLLVCEHLVFQLTTVLQIIFHSDG